MQPITRHGGNAINARYVTHAGIVYLSGLVADDKSAGIKEQTSQILSKIDKLLSDAGTDKSRLLSALIWLNDMTNKDAMNEVWSAWMDHDNPPVRACVGAELSSATTLIEIMVTAAKD